MSAEGWSALERPAVSSVSVGGVAVRAGTRVRLHPRPGGDIMDLALDGRAAVVEAVEQGVEGQVTLAVVLDDDPGRDLGFARALGHRFFFAPDEVDPAGAGSLCELPVPAPRVLIAGIGNVFLGDDGFGVALAQRLATEALPAGVEVHDYGLRGLDLAFAMQEGYDAVVMLDAAARGQAPGTLYVIEADPDDGADTGFDAHGMHPLAVLGLVQAWGGRPPRTLVVACEPGTRIDPDGEELDGTLSAPVQAALEPAVELVQALVRELTDPNQAQEGSS